MRPFLLILILPFALWAQEHLLISEAFIPAAAEQNAAFIEIYNPTDQPISLENIYLANYKTYYEMVNAAYTNNIAEFIVKFPIVNLPAKQNRVIALNGSGYQTKFSLNADFEISSKDPDTPDMDSLKIGSNIKLESSKGMLVLFQWDGITDLVQDIDYLPWGFFTSSFMDKGGITIDGPDDGTETSAYLDDLAVASQKKATAPTGGQSLQRNGLTEVDEVLSGGNGLTGHNEATEDWTVSFVPGNPSPGSFSEVEGDGSGSAEISPLTADAATNIDVTVSFTGTADYILTTAAVIIPAGWNWSQSAEDVLLAGTAFDGANILVSQDTIRIENMLLTDTQTGSLTISGLTSPSQTSNSIFIVQTAVAGGNLSRIASSPTISVIATLTIADIQNNFAEYEGQQVTIEGVVAIGSGITTNAWTDVYIQDQSGRGINVYRAGEIVSGLDKGNQIRVTGTVTDFSGTTELEDFTFELLSSGNQIPAVSKVNIASASNIELEGTMIETAGVINDIFAVGGGTNITIEDGSGNVVVRVWDNSGVNLAGFTLGDTIGVRAIIDIFSNAAQLLVGYQEDIFEGALETAVDGSGVVLVDPSKVDLSAMVDLTFSFQSTATDTVAKISILVPDVWQWSASETDIILNGAFDQSSISITGNLIELTDAVLNPTNNGSLQINNLTAPAVDTVSSFIIKTAGRNGSFQEIAASPIVTVGEGTQINAMSIAEVRAKVTELIDGPITIKGTIAIGAGILRDDFTSAYIVDENSAGLNVFRFGELDPDIVRGNLLILSGTLTAFDGVLEIEDYTTTVLATNTPLPDPLQLNTGEAAKVDFEGSWVEVEGIVKDKFTAGPGINMVLDDASGEVTVRIWNTTGVDVSTFDVGSFVKIQGIHSLFNNAGQILLAYQEDASPLELSGVPISLNVEAKPFAPDKGEEMEILYSSGSGNTFVTMRIYDMGGRLITTLLDETGLPFEWKTSWDGRDELGEQVPIGTYILHFEVVNEDSGKKTQKVAPIVVGTVLSR